MILVTGVTGTIGRELCRELDAQGAAFRGLVRDPARAVGLSPRMELVIGDLDQPATLPSAFEGIDKVFLLTPGIGISHATNAAAAALAAGVRHIVHLSSFNVLGDPMPAMGRWHHQREEIIRGTGILATFLRPGGFMTNALDWVSTIREGGYVLDPVGPGRLAPIDPADIAAVAAIALIREGHQGREYVLTGGEALTVTEQVRTLSELLGRDIEIREVCTPGEAIRFRFPAGAPPALAEAITEAFVLLRADTVGFRTSTVAQLLGRAPGTFRSWCARNIEAFRERH